MRERRPLRGSGMAMVLRSGGQEINERRGEGRIGVKYGEYMWERNREWDRNP